MPKFTLRIEPDIGYGFVIWAEAFGHEAAVGFRKKKRAGRGRAGTELSIDMQDSDFSEDTSESGSNQPRDEDTSEES